MKTPPAKTPLDPQVLAKVLARWVFEMQQAEERNRQERRFER